MDWDYDKVLNLFKKRENYCGKPWFKIIQWGIKSDQSVLIRVTKNVLLIADSKCITIYSPVKNSYRVESESVIYYDDIEDIRITHIPLFIDFKLKNIKTTISILTPLKMEWGYDVKALPVYCEDRWNEMVGIKSKGVKE